MKASKISIPGKTIVQESLFGNFVPENNFFEPFPVVGKTEKEFLQVLENFKPKEGLGIDYEFYQDKNNNNKPTVIGIANSTEIAALPANDKLTKLSWEAVRDKKSTFVGYSIFGAELPILTRVAPESAAMIYWDDAMIMHWLDNATLCKQTTGKEEDEAGGGLGFMNLWIATSMYCDVSNWKVCRGNDCFGPCPYHKVFDYCGVDSWAGLQVKLRAMKSFISRGGNIEIYRKKLLLGNKCSNIQSEGVFTDKARVRELDKKAEAKKELLFSGHEINPKSSPDKIKKLNSLGIKTNTSDVKFILKQLNKTLKDNDYVDLETFESRFPEGHADFEPHLIADTIEDPKLNFLYRLYKYQKTGKGGKSWFDEKYYSKDGLIHARYNFTGTSSGRLSSSKPNFQNVPKNGFGEEIRDCIIAPEGYDFIKCDSSQLELRIMLWGAGVDPNEAGLDAFTWVVQQGNGLFEKAAEILNNGWDARDTAKSFSHAANYLEGLKLLKPYELDLPRIKNEIKYGALRIFHDWTFRGYIVGFTGANLAERILGQKTLENRKKMLEIQQDVYFKAFPQIQAFHRKLLGKYENDTVFKLPSGRILDLYGPDLDDCKILTATFGQGTGADYIQEGMIKLEKTPIAQVHDEVDLYVPTTMSDKDVLELCRPMVSEHSLLPGMRGPAKVMRGKSWKEKTMKVIGKLQ